MRSDGAALRQLVSCGDGCGFTQIQWAAQGDRIAFASIPDPRIGHTVRGTVGVADTSTGRVHTLSVRTRAALTPTIAWAPDERALALVNRQPGAPATLSTITVDRTALGTATVVSRDAYPPLTWLPSAR
jgi:hypothetical protein